MRGKNMSVALAVILLSGLVMMTGCGNTKAVEPEADTELVEVEENTTETIETVEEESKTIDKKCEDYFAKAKNVTIEKVDRMTVDDLDGNSKTKYYKYLVSDVDFTDITDDTSDYAKALEGGELDDSKVEQIEFENAFGTNYEDKSAWELFQEILINNGFDKDMNDVSFDEDAYDLAGQNVYVVNEKCSVLDYLLEGVNYDELLESKVFYQMRELPDGVVVPDCLTAVVQYRVGDQTFTKTVFLQMAVNDLCTTEEE